MVKTIGYFMETGIWFQGKEQSPRKTPVILIGGSLLSHPDDFSEEDDIPVLSEDGNWYTIKRKELVFEK